MRVSMLVLWLMFTAAPAHAQEATRLELKSADLPASGAAWYGVYIGRAKVGWVHDYIERDKEGRIVSAYSMHMQVRQGDEVFRMANSQRLVFDATPPYRLHSAHKKEDQGGGQTTVSLVRTKDGYQATIVNAGTERVVPATLDYTLADSLAAEIWLRRGVKVGDAMTSWSLDLDDLKLNTETVRVTELRVLVIGGVRQRVYMGTLKSSKRGDSGRFVATNSGKLLSIAEGSFEARREPESVAKKLDEAHDLLALLSVPVDKPLGNPATIVELVIEVNGRGAEHIASSTRQTASVSDAGKRTLKIGAGHGAEAKATPEELKECLESTTRYPAENKRVAGMAKGAIGASATAQAKVRDLLRFVADYVEDEYGREYPTALDVIRSGRGDCDAHARLFVALARAVGVPAREVSGYMYMGDAQKAFGGHAWCEVVLDGRWVEVDPTWNQMQIDATHISFRGKDGESRFHKVMGRISVTLVDLKRR